MRVISGRFGGRTLVAPSGRQTRPTPERVREAVFSILGPVESLRVLDLFAGSGALGIEAVSRGAGELTLVDSSRRAIEAITRNLRTLEINAEVRGQPVLAFLEQAKDQGREYDLVFVDPPYGDALRLGPQLSAALGPVLVPDARVVFESDRRRPPELDPLRRVDERRYGDTLIRIYANAPSR
ncbi:MAG: 16S rRNA (guanine(966)-N(2))-methyltransferase RsmD [Solirubrobacterales bacterium]|nr:16S rRNA (guanine(966)-N(2))-methyltransferase RsmD [Solirubrobacterales bacterium]